MKFNSFKNCIFALCGTILLFTACEKIEDEPSISSKNLKGMFVVGEGNYTTSDGDVSFYNPDSAQYIKRLYFNANQTNLGSVVQSFMVVDTLGFIVVNNSQKITVVNMKDFKLIKTIKGFSYPRHMVRANDNTVYVTNGDGYSNNYIYSIDLVSLTKKDSLALPKGPENLIALNSKVYATLNGGWSNDGNSVIEINPSSFKIENTFEVAPVPVDLVADKNNNIWVYSLGIAHYDADWKATYENSGICKINTSTKKVTTFPIANMTASGYNNITTSKDGNTIYFLNDGLYAMPITASTLPTSKLVDQRFYGVDVDPKTGFIICLDAINLKAVGYDSKGLEQFSFETTMYPNSVVFSY